MEAISALNDGDRGGWYRTYAVGQTMNVYRNINTSFLRVARGEAGAWGEEGGWQVTAGVAGSR